MTIGKPGWPGSSDDTGPPIRPVAMKERYEGLSSDVAATLTEIEEERDELRVALTRIRDMAVGSNQVGIFWEATKALEGASFHMEYQDDPMPPAGASEGPGPIQAATPGVQLEDWLRRIGGEDVPWIK